jgi:hypothetical protein
MFSGQNGLLPVKTHEECEVSPFCRRIWQPQALEGLNENVPASDILLCLSLEESTLPRLLESCGSRLLQRRVGSEDCGGAVSADRGRQKGLADLCESSRRGRI